MSNEKSIIGEVNVEVKAGLSVDEKTAHICMELLAIHFKQCGAKGVVLRFDDSDYVGVGVQVLSTTTAVSEAIIAGVKYNNKED